MFLSKRTTIHIQWHKDGERVNKEVMVHPSDSNVWKVLDNFDPEFTQDARNVRIGLAIDTLHVLVTTQRPTPVGPRLLFHIIFLLFA
jgi:hypothetical protein